MHNRAKTIAGTWENFRMDFAKINPELTNIIDQLDPGPDLRLYKITYPYGSEIVKDGVFYIPDNNGSLIPINHPELPEQMHNDLSYNSRSIPIGFMLKNSIEVFVQQKGKSLPLIGQKNYVGKLFGLSNNINNINSNNNFHIPTALWNLTSGGRSIFMLPKISNVIGHNKIKKHFNININPPKSLADQWEVFRAIYNSDQFKNPWEVEVIFFSESWLKKSCDIQWISFIHYCYRHMISLTDYFRKSQTWEAMLSLLKVDKNFFHDPDVNQKTKHILGVATGELPAFAPVTDDSFGPMQDLQEIYNTIYDLKEHAPIILQPMFLDLKQAKKPVYYSLNHPVTPFSSDRDKEHSVISTLNDTANLINKYLRLISEQEDKLLIPQFDSIINNIEFNYYHSSSTSYSFVNNAQDITKYDPRWHKNNKTIASHGPFVQGCVQILPKSSLKESA